MNENPNKNLNNTPEIKKDKYMELVNDFHMLITLNATRLDQQILPGQNTAIIEFQQSLRKPIINGLNYSDFVTEKWDKLNDPVVAQTLLTQIHGFLQYIEPRLDIFKPDASWVEQYKKVKQKYVDLVSTK